MPATCALNSPVRTASSLSRRSRSSAAGKTSPPRGRPSQSSTSNGGDAATAIDGNKNPTFAAGGQTHTVEGGKTAETRGGSSTSVRQARSKPSRSGTVVRASTTASTDSPSPFSTGIGNRSTRRRITVVQNRRSTSTSPRTRCNTRASRSARRSQPTTATRAFAFKKGDTHRHHRQRPRRPHAARRLDRDAPPGRRHRDLELTFRNLSLHRRPGEQVPPLTGLHPARALPPATSRPTSSSPSSATTSPSTRSPRPTPHELEAMIDKYRGLKPNGKHPAHRPLLPDRPRGPRQPEPPERQSRTTPHLALNTGATEAGRREAASPSSISSPRPRRSTRANAEPLTINGVHLNAAGQPAGRRGDRHGPHRQGDHRLRQPRAAARGGARQELALAQPLPRHRRQRHLGRPLGPRNSSTARPTPTCSSTSSTMLDVMTANRDPKIWARRQRQGPQGRRLATSRRRSR